MKAGGKTIKLTGKAASSMLMAMCMMAFGSMIVHMALVFITMQMELFTKVCGKKITNMEKASKSGQMAKNFKENMYSAKRKAMDHIFGPMVVLMKETGKIIPFKDTVFTPGLMAAVMKALSKIARWKAREPIHGLMAENILASMSMIKRKVTELIFGPMAVNSKANGRMENNMVKAKSQVIIVKLVGDSGKTDRE